MFSDSLRRKKEYLANLGFIPCVLQSKWSKSQKIFFRNVVRAGSVVEIVSVSSPLFPSVFCEAHYYFSQNSLFHKCFNGRKWHNGDSYPYSPVFLDEKPKSSRDVSLKLPPNTRSRFQLLDVIILLFSTSFLVFGVQLPPPH